MIDKDYLFRISDMIRAIALEMETSMLVSEKEREVGAEEIIQT